MSKNKSWHKDFVWNGKKFSYGFIDEGGEKYGDRHYFIIDDLIAPISLADKLVPLFVELYGLPSTQAKGGNE